MAMNKTQPAEATLEGEEVEQEEVEEAELQEEVHRLVRPKQLLLREEAKL